MKHVCVFIDIARASVATKTAQLSCVDIGTYSSSRYVRTYYLTAYAWGVLPLDEIDDAAACAEETRIEPDTSAVL